MADFNGSKSVRFERGNYLVDVLQGNNTKEPFWYYVLQRTGSSEILGLARFDTSEQAIEAAQGVLEKMNRSAAAAK